MTDWNRIASEKAAYRKSSAERPLDEKLRTLDRLHERSKSLGIETSRRKDTPGSGDRTSNLTVFGASHTFVVSARAATTTTEAVLFADNGNKR